MSTDSSISQLTTSEIDKLISSQRCRVSRLKKIASAPATLAKKIEANRQLTVARSLYKTLLTSRFQLEDQTLERSQPSL